MALPLHPPRTSIPMTCVGSAGQQFDLVFHVLYTPNRELTCAFVRTMATRLAAMTNADAILSLLPCIGEEAGIDTVQAAWILLMNVDMQMKQLIVDPALLANRKAFACSAEDNAQTWSEGGGWGSILRSIGPVDKGKAKRFFVDLSVTTIPQWLQNELRTSSDLVRTVKALYLNS